MNRCKNKTVLPAPWRSTSVSAPERANSPKPPVRWRENPVGGTAITGTGGTQTG